MSKGYHSRIEEGGGPLRAMTVDIGPNIGALSSKLTHAIADVELQRSTIEQVVHQLAEQARHLSEVANTLNTAAVHQGEVLQALQQASSAGVDSGIGNKLQTAAECHSYATATLSAVSGNPAGPSSPNVPIPAGPPLSVSSPGTAASSQQPELNTRPCEESLSSWGGSSRAESPTPVPEPAPPPGRPRSATMPVTRPTAPPPRISTVIEPDMSEEEGIEYIKGLHITGVWDSVINLVPPAPLPPTQVAARLLLLVSCSHRLAAACRPDRAYPA